MTMMNILRYAGKQFDWPDILHFQANFRKVIVIWHNYPRIDATFKGLFGPTMIPDCKTSLDSYRCSVIISHHWIDV